MICGKTFMSFSAGFLCSTECKRVHALRYKAKPRNCACGTLGVKIFGSEWVCQRCWDIEKRMDEAKAKPRRELVYGAMWHQSPDYYRVSIGVVA